MRCALAMPTAGSIENQRPPAEMRAFSAPSVKRPAVTNFAARACSNQPATRSVGWGVSAAKRSRRPSSASWRWPRAVFRSSGKAFS